MKQSCWTMRPGSYDQGISAPLSQTGEHEQVDEMRCRQSPLLSGKQRRIIGRLVTAAAAAVLLGPAPALAQLNGQNIKGDMGLKSGSQAPPGTYVAIPLWFYSADAVKDRDGNEILTGNLDAALLRRGAQRRHAEKDSRRQLRLHGRAAVGEQPGTGRGGFRLQSRSGADGHVHPADQAGGICPRSD